MTSDGSKLRTLKATVATFALLTGANAFAVDFATRCADSHVVRCVDFDSPAVIAGGYGSNSGSFPGDSIPQIDATIKASGAGSLKFTIPSLSSADSSGSYFTNFSNDLSVRFGGNADFFVQWRQRFSPEMLNVVFAGGGGWKQAIIGTGDEQGKTFVASCTALETVTQNTFTRGYPQMYNSCTGSTSHGAYDPFNPSYGAYDFKMQNARPAPFCLYSQGNTNPPTNFPPVGNCFGYFANEWMTFQVEIKTGPRVNDEFQGSYIRLWVARAGQPSELVIDFGPYNLVAGPPAENQSYGKVWLLPYNTGKNNATSYPVAYTWYDELIISTARIADPDASGVAPNPPTNVSAQ